MLAQATAEYEHRYADSQTWRLTKDVQSPTELLQDAFALHSSQDVPPKTMEKRSLYCLLYWLAFCPTINLFVAATSIVPIFSDVACQDNIFTGQIDQQKFNGTCQSAPPGANSVDPSHLDSCCAVTVYTDPYCSYNSTLAPTGYCTGLSIGSYSVDCPCLPSTSPQSTSSAIASTSFASTSAISPSGSRILGTVQLVSTNHTTSNEVPSSTSTPSTVNTSPSAATAQSTHLPLSSSSLQSLSSSSPSSTSAANKEGRGSNGGNNLSIPGQISLGVILPVLSLIVAVVFGMRQWRHAQ